MDIKNLPDVTSLVDDIQDFIDNPNFQPKNQNKWFFSDGLSYYQQLLEIYKVLEYFQQAFKIVQENEDTIGTYVDTLLPLPEQVENMQKEINEFIEKFNPVPEQIEELTSQLTTLSTTVQNEIAKLNQLQNDLNSESNTRESADTVLQTNIDNEEKARIDGDSALQTSIDNEVKARTSADTTLQGNIDKEVSDRESAIADVLAQIGTIKGTVVEDGTDIDEMKTTGIYCCNGAWSGDTPSKYYPETSVEYFYNSKATLIVMAFQDIGIRQILISNYTNDTYEEKHNTGTIYYRNLTDNSYWEDWEKEINSNYLDSFSAELITGLASMFLQNVKFNNNENITFTQASREDGTLTYDVAVIGSTPANLTANLTLQNANDYNILNNFGADTSSLDSTTSTSYLEFLLPYKMVTGGSQASKNVGVGRYDKQYFKASGNMLTFNTDILNDYAKQSNVDTELDELTTTLNQAINLKANQTDLSSEIDNREHADTTLQANIDETNTLLNTTITNLNKLLKGQSVANNTNIDEIKDNGFYHQVGDWSGTLPDIGGYEWHYSNLLAFNCGVDVCVQVLFHFSTSMFCVRTGRGTTTTEWADWAIYNTSTEEMGANFTKAIATINQNITNLTNNKQDSLVSGTNIKTINSESLLGSGDISLPTETTIQEKINATFSLSGTTLTITTE